MKKSKIVSYSSEELKQLPSQSDWAAANAMTDEEILAAIADDPDDSELLDWRPRQTRRTGEDDIVMFVAAYDKQGQLAMHRVVKVVSDGDKSGTYVRVVDDTGASHRVPLQGAEDATNRT